MLSAVLTKYSIVLLPTIACLLFVTLFILVLAWVMRPEAKKLYQQAGMMPLLDGQQQGVKK